MNLVVGSTGFLGGEICRRLRLEGRPVRGLVRPTSDPAAVDRLKALGVEIVVGDLKDPASLRTAGDGVHTVISTTTSMRSRQEGDSIESVDGDGQRNLVGAASAMGVSRYVYVSYSEGLGKDAPLTRAKRSVEEAIRQSGMTYTILRPSYFMEVWLGPTVGFDFPNAKATLFGTGENPVSWIALADVAAFAVASLENPAARNAVLELGGPEALAPIEVVRIFEELGGRTFEVQHVAEEALLARGAAATDSRAQTFAALMLSCAQGNAIDMAETLARFPLHLTSVRDYAGRVLGRG